MKFFLKTNSNLYRSTLGTAFQNSEVNNITQANVLVTDSIPLSVPKNIKHVLIIKSVNEEAHTRNIVEKMSYFRKQEIAVFVGSLRGVYDKLKNIARPQALALA